MAKPRVFISSTFYDFRQVRNDLEGFIKELGYVSVRNETGAIPYGNELKLEDYCYQEISNIDILIGIIGGRFGSESGHGNNSITQLEIKTAIEQNKQVYIFIEKNVLTEFETYLINKDNEKTKYKFVDDTRIYKFIEELDILPRNNIIIPFESADDIVDFLKEQWAGLFYDLLNQKNKKGQYESIDQKVTELTAIASTIKTYLESVLQNVTHKKSDADNLIHKEKEKLDQFHHDQQFLSLDFIKHLQTTHQLALDSILHGIKNYDTLSELRKYFQSKAGKQKNFGCFAPLNNKNFESLNEAREILGMKVYLNEPKQISKATIINKSP